MKIIIKELTDIFQNLVDNLFPDKELKPVEITVATNENFGDYQCNFAMINSKIIGDNPRKIAEEIKAKFPYGEIVEKLEVAGENQTLATITLQNYFRMYEKLSGMTGTAKTEEDEFKQIYKLKVIV